MSEGLCTPRGENADARVGRRLGAGSAWDYDFNVNNYDWSATLRPDATGATTVLVQHDPPRYEVGVPGHYNHCVCSVCQTYREIAADQRARFESLQSPKRGRRRTKPTG